MPRSRQKQNWTYGRRQNLYQEQSAKYQGLEQKAQAAAAKAATAGKESSTTTEAEQAILQLQKQQEALPAELRQQLDGAMAIFRDVVTKSAEAEKAKAEAAKRDKEAAKKAEAASQEEPDEKMEAAPRQEGFVEWWAQQSCKRGGGDGSEDCDPALAVAAMQYKIYLDESSDAKRQKKE